MPSEFCVIICGMHRAGTSYISRLFYEWGVYMGPSEISKPDYANPEGEYENPKFVSLNNALLSAVGGSWNYPVFIESLQRVAQFEATIRSLITETRRPLWGWKDNRTAFTFKAYEPFIDNPFFVVCKREKAAVVKSLAKTHEGQFRECDRTPEYYAALYDQYYEAIDLSSQGYPRIVINYETMAGSSFFNPQLQHFK